MSQQAHETVEVKGVRASNTNMDSSPRHPDDDVKRETPAVTDAGSCPVCHLIAGVAVGMATIIILTGLLLYLGLFAAQEAEQTSKTSAKELMQRLQQCQKERHDLNLMLHIVTQDSRCSVCPVSWLWWKGHCYFFSVGLQENRQWNESAEFCRGHNSSLAVIKDSAEMEFIQGVMRKFPQLPFLWVGLTDSKQEGQWLWWDGTDIQHYMQVTVEWDAGHRDCADLRGDGSLFAAECEAYGPWVCKRAS
uniref:CD209 antigen-like protein C n=2 Tax=Seriola dumerili TaxID=41447 RepID=A0A3B4VBQ1_SERDU